MLLDVPTQLYDEKNAEFRTLFKHHYQKDISKEDANTLALTLMQLLEIIIEYHKGYHQ